VSVKACEGLMLIASLPDDTCAYHIVNHTTFTEQLTSQLCTLYSSLPKVMDPNDVESVDARWG
jgi:Retinoic acid induced 16-like protein